MELPEDAVCNILLKLAMQAYLSLGYRNVIFEGDKLINTQVRP